MALGSLGWRGYMRVGGTAGPVLPYLSADLSESTEVNPSASIHGGGVGSSDGVYHSEHNFAIGRATYEGTVNGEVFGGITGNYAAAFLALIQRAIGASSGDTSMRDDGFGSTTQLIFSPGGGFQFKFPKASSVGKCVINSFSLNGNNGGNVQYSAGMISSGADYNSNAANAPLVPDFAFETAGLTDDSNPVPYYATNFNIDGTLESDLSDRVTDWNIAVANNSAPIFTFNGDNFAVDVLQGMMVVTGSFSYYSPLGTFVQYMTHGGAMTISLGNITLNSPFVAFGPYPVPSPGPNDPTVRNVTFRCLAHGTKASLYIT